MLKTYIPKAHEEMYYQSIKNRKKREGLTIEEERERLFKCPLM